MGDRKKRVKARNKQFIAEWEASGKADYEARERAAGRLPPDPTVHGSA